MLPTTATIPLLEKNLTFFLKKIGPTSCRYRKKWYLCTAIGLWCNGNTTDSGPVIHGSSPCSPTERAKIERFLLFFCCRQIPTYRHIPPHRHRLGTKKRPPFEVVICFWLLNTRLWRLLPLVPRVGVHHTCLVHVTRRVVAILTLTPPAPLESVGPTCGDCLHILLGDDKG